MSEVEQLRAENAKLRDELNTRKVGDTSEHHRGYCEGRDALRATFCAVLAEALGVEPGLGTVRLLRVVREQRDSLLAIAKVVKS